MASSVFSALTPVVKRVAPFAAAVAIAGAGVGYAVHEHHSARSMAVQNQQMTAQLRATDSQIGMLAAKVNSLETAEKAREKPSPSIPVRRVDVPHRADRDGLAARDPRFTKLQSQVDAQGGEIDQTRSDLANTRNDLTNTQANMANTRTQLTGSIARTHAELVALERKGQRNYYEFDIWKSKEYGRTGPISIRLRKANVKHQFANLQLVVDDRNMMQKHVNLYQPVLFYEPDSPQPIEVVINRITRNEIRGYVSAPKYRQSELTAMARAGANATPGADQAANSGAEPALRRRLPVPTAGAGQR